VRGRYTVGKRGTGEAGGIGVPGSAENPSGDATTPGMKIDLGGLHGDQMTCNPSGKEKRVTRKFV
jgi:hypothetical protein